MQAHVAELRGTSILMADLSAYRRQLLSSPWVAVGVILAGSYAAIGAIFHVDPYAEGDPWATTAGPPGPAR